MKRKHSHRTGLISLRLCLSVSLCVCVCFSVRCALQPRPCLRALPFQRSAFSPSAASSATIGLTNEKRGGGRSAMEMKRRGGRRRDAIRFLSFDCSPIGAIHSRARSHCPRTPLLPLFLRMILSAAPDGDGSQTEKRRARRVRKEERLFRFADAQRRHSPSGRTLRRGEEQHRQFGGHRQHSHRGSINLAQLLNSRSFFLRFTWSFQQSGCKQTYFDY